MARAAALLEPRAESLGLLRFCLEKEIPVWIVSAGLENVIRFWLGQQEIPDEKIRILANRIRYGEENPRGRCPSLLPGIKRTVFSAGGKVGGPIPGVSGRSEGRSVLERGKRGKLSVEREKRLSRNVPGRFWKIV